jgi:imidazolonepropionase-like amidohydrolase
LGGHGVEIGRAVAEGTVLGPAIYGAGAMLTITGGHGDVAALPQPLRPDESVTRRVCNGVTDCVVAVREQIRRGADVIKVCVSGGVMSDRDVDELQFSVEELRAIVAEAGRGHRAVAAHAHGKPGIIAAVEAGVTTIEHGSRLDEEAAEAMSRNGVLLVPTRAILEAVRERKSELSPEAYARGVALEEENRNAVAIAAAHGVRIAVGSDLGVSGAVTRHGYVSAGAELGALVRTGMRPEDVVVAATANGPLTLGPRAPRSGRLAPGFDADAIAIDFDPLAHPDQWGHAERVTHVWRAGRLVKSPL